jgi:hypothetical protein
MQTVTTIGLDIAKSVFQVHGVDAAGQVVIRRQLKRRYVLAFFQKLPPCLIGIEACASSHHWSRELQALGTVAAYFSTAPFLGAIVSVAALGEKVTAQLFVAGALMAIGVWLHLTELHEHEHDHESIMHAHPHVHDEHHRHEHDPQDPPGEPHTHSHRHGGLRHAHPHVPDAHHQHLH